VIRQLRRTAVGLVAAGTMLAGVAACAAHAYTYASDSADHAYFKVPSNWPEVGPKALFDVQVELGSTLAGQAGSDYAWVRAYDAATHPSPGDLLAGSRTPAVFASVQDLKSSMQAALSYNTMRDLLFPYFPVTATARQQATTDGIKLTGFNLLGSNTISTKDGVRGINELYEYTVGGQIVVFDQTVLTNTDTTKLYLLLVQCDEQCFASHAAQIKTVVDSFTVRGS
jgi:hypothetical protein